MYRLWETAGFPGTRLVRNILRVRDSKALCNAEWPQPSPSVKRSPRETSIQRKIEVKDVNGI